MLVVCKKDASHQAVHEFTEDSFEEDFIKNIFIDTINSGLYETNEIIVEFLKRFFKERVIIKNSNIISLLNEVATFDGKGWIINNENI